MKTKKEFDGNHSSCNICSRENIIKYYGEHCRCIHWFGKGNQPCEKETPIITNCKYCGSCTGDDTEMCDVDCCPKAEKQGQIKALKKVLKIITSKEYYNKFGGWVKEVVEEIEKELNDKNS